MLNLSESQPRTARSAEPEVSVSGRGWLEVIGKKLIAPRVAELTLAATGDLRLPDWSPGAHIDLILPNGLTRQYSLSGNRWDPSTYRIAVLKERVSRGGSAYIHEHLSVGDRIEYGGPRNHFRLSPAREYLFVAGGIGITPILPMIDQAERMEVPWRLVYLGRERAQLAYLDQLVRAYGERVTAHCSTDSGPAEVERWKPQDPAVRVFACGSSRLLNAVERWGAPPGGFAPRMERFSAASAGASDQATAFTVVAVRSGTEVEVRTRESIVDALQRAGVRVLTSCSQGVCGTCEVDVIAGRPDHRDSVLTAAERSEGRCILPCVSRSRDSQLVLDL